ncbi:hypothetical protein JWS92_002718 [Enterococcus faecalis]|nr:hypothetical protein [Enterococcus faecalis]
MFAEYCKASTNYIIITSLLDKNTQSVVSVIQKTNFSISHVYTKMKTINEFLALYGIFVTFTKTGTRNITGTEIQLQYCILDVYWAVFSNTALPFKEENPKIKKILWII